MKKFSNDERSFGYRLGNLFASLMFLCISAILVAMTVKVILWMF